MSDSIRPNLTGKTIGNYNFKSLLGEGGQATVWKAQQVIDQRFAAIKVFCVERGRTVDAEIARKAFESEISALANLPYRESFPVYYGSHNEICNIDSSGTVYLEEPFAVPVPDDATEYVLFLLIMELVEPGYSPGDYHNSVVRSDRDRALRHILGVARALASFHELERYHFDIKPSNLLRSAKADVLLLADFGLTHYLGKSGIMNDFAGTVSYLAPECFDGVTQTNEAARDVYALGITIFELLAGRHPFHDLSLKMDWQLIHATATRPKLSEIATWISPRFSLTIREMLDSDPKRRPPLTKVIDVIDNEIQNRSRARVRPDTLTEASRARAKLERSVEGFRVNSRSRHLFHQHIPVFFSLKLRDNRKWESSVQKLHALLEFHVGLTYSICEVYGSRSFMIQVWAKSNRELVPLLRGLREVGENVRVAGCDAEKTFVSREPSMVLNRLNRADVIEHFERHKRGDKGAIESLEWLKKKGLIHPSPLEQKGIIAWCGGKLDSREARTPDGRLTAFRALTSVFREHFADRKRIDVIDIYMVDHVFSKMIAAEAESEVSDFDILVSFCAKDFDSLPLVKNCLRNETSYEPSTILESKEHTVLFPYCREPWQQDEGESSDTVTAAFDETTLPPNKPVPKENALRSVDQRGYEL